MKIKQLLASLLLSLMAQALWADTSKTKVLDVIIPSHQIAARAHDNYFVRLLDLALSKTEAEYGPYKIHEAARHYTSNRLIRELIQNTGEVSVIWTANSLEREEVIHPIKFSILRGLNSYRVFLIRAEDQAKFARIETLAQLGRLRAGQGAQWPDTQVLEKNHLPVITVVNSNLLFGMLKGRRFDYLPRGLHEVHGEQASFADQGIVTEQELMLHYPSPIYFFVSKKNISLAERIEHGLKIAEADGSFEQLFFSVEGFKLGYQELINNKRRRFDLASDLQDMD